MKRLLAAFALVSMATAFAAPISLSQKQELAKTSLKVGDKVKIEYRPLRDGKLGGLLMSGYSDDGKLIGNPIRGPEGGAPPASQ